MMQMAKSARLIGAGLVLVAAAFGKGDPGVLEGDVPNRANAYPTPYSCLSATIGFTPIARCAGT